MIIFKSMKNILYILSILLISASIASCDGGDSGGRKPVYVKPSVDKNGRFRKGHVRMPVSTKKNAVKNQNKSKYYYQTRGKYRRKSKN
jgi:hypothetical protein